ncbi:MAG: ABC transporter ATP-binding protein [Pseudomonadota bacterium]
MSVIEASNLRVARGGKTVLNGVSLSVEQGEVFAMLGGNGAGKSTTLLSFLGFLPPVSGEVSVLGQPVYNDISAVRTAVAYLPESVALYGHLSARENLTYFLKLAGVERTAAEVDAVLDQVSLQGDARDTAMDQYSKGMRQKTAIALAILRESPVLFLDEPTSGLDPAAIDEFSTLVGNLAAAGSTVFMVTHDVYGACQVADRIVLLQQGNIVGAFEAPEEGQIDTEAVHAAFSGAVA